ncbi:MAG TPA: glycoside hydrolase family 2 TIM barrel-domain containing protein [Dongiaceae bacterium]|nr:glycoside hydrolase family 2 TIM barrel-domain containing protein [Dongiaceae bacterium]
MKHICGSFTQGIGVGLRWARLLVVAGGLTLGSRALAQATLPPEIEDPECLGINKEPAHATLMPYKNLAEALAARRSDSSWCRSLNGQWKFNWVPRPEVRPVDFYKPDFDDHAWKEIPVPSCWQLEGYGTPFYRNNGYTFQKDWPHVLAEPPRRFTSYVERDPVGSYRHEFTVPAEWQGRRVFLDFAGVDSAFYLWINGVKVGFSVNSRNAAEFDITKYLQPGTNLLAVEVYQYSAGSYVEDQDMWRLSGIFRNVTLWSAPAVHLRDFFIKTDLDSQYQDATVEIEAKVKNYGDAPTAAGTCAAILYDAKGRKVSGATAKGEVPALQPGEEKAVTLHYAVANPAKWTAETPNLYTTVLQLSGAAGEELISTRTGFRKVEIKGRVFMINGVPVKLKGANRHENWPETGHYVTEAEMIRDLELLKQGNCNHVRTCHYSDDPRWYELCDEWGIYLNAEANVECHGYYGVLDHEPKYEKAIVDRNVANVQSFKNHAAVIMWSLGNECGGGSNFVFALHAVKALDTSRPVHYEPFGIGARNPADVDSRMYMDIASLARAATNDAEFTKPLYLCEYAHAMFNSMGSLGDYNDVFDKYPTLMGGAIWEWQDQGIWNRRDPKRQFIAFGGGFGDYPNDHYFIHKGVVFSDRSPKPHYPEMKRVYQWIAAAPVDLAAGKIKIRNKYAFISLAGFQGEWTLCAAGQVIDQGVLPQLHLAPGAEQEVTVPFRIGSPKPGAEYFLRISFTLNHDEIWARKGYEVAADQFELPAPKARPAPATLASVQLAENGPTITVSGTGFQVEFDKTTGTISQLMRDGQALLLPGGGPRLHLWRAPHQKDDMWAYADWHAYGLDDLHWTNVQIKAVAVSPGVVRVETQMKGEGKNRFSVLLAANYNIYGDGSIVVDNALRPQGRRIPLARVAVRLLLPPQYDRFTYLGRGPMENYSDRKRGSDVGLYTSTVAEQMTPYAKPMECGNHEDIRWAAVSGQGRPALMAQAVDGLLQASALPYQDEVMTPVEYSIDLPPSTNTVLVVAAHTLGVGSYGCGPRPLEPYMVRAEPVTFSYRLRLLPTAANLPEAGLWQAAPERTMPAMPESDLDEHTIPAKVIAASSYESGEGDPEHATDGDYGTFWHSRWSQDEARPPHFLVLDYGQPVRLGALTYVAREDGDNGHVRDYEIYVSQDGQDWGTAVAHGRFRRDNPETTISLTPVTARYLKFVMLSEQNGRPFCSVAELITEKAPN